MFLWHVDHGECCIVMKGTKVLTLSALGMYTRGNNACGYTHMINGHNYARAYITYIVGWAMGPSCSHFSQK